MKNVLLMILLIFPGWASEISRQDPTALVENDGIQVSVIASAENDGRTLIKCILTNHSKHILASALPRTRSLCFRFKLKDQIGNLIPMESDWALIHAQPDGTNESALARRSWMDIHIKPDESYDFQFFLEEAFGALAKNGKTLEVKWLNIDALPEGYNILKYNEIKNSDGTVIPAYQEVNHFPGLREFVVELPLTDDAQATGDAQPAATPGASVKPAYEPALQAQPQGSKQSSTPKSFDLRWLLLFLVPGLILLFRFLRSRAANQSK